VLLQIRGTVVLHQIARQMDPETAESLQGKFLLLETPSISTNSPTYTILNQHVTEAFYTVANDELFNPIRLIT